MQAVREINELPTVLTVADVQKIMGISRVTAYELVNTEGFPSFRIGSKGGRIVIPRDSFMRWLEQKAGA